MNETFKPLIEDKITLWSFSLSLIIFITSVLYTFITFSRLPPLIPLFNRMPWGYARLGDKYQIFIPLSLVFIFFVTNVVIAAVAYKKAVLLSRMVSAITFAIVLCTSIYIFEIIQLVI